MAVGFLKDVGFRVADNGFGLGEGQKLELQMFKISTNESRK
jgi:hypothetical protein